MFLINISVFPINYFVLTDQIGSYASITSSITFWRMSTCFPSSNVKCTSPMTLDYYRRLFHPIQHRVFLRTNPSRSKSSLSVP